MAGKVRVWPIEPLSNDIAPTRNGLGPEHVIEIQRARIFAAIVEVSVEHGAGNVTVAHIVERAGVSRRTFYELFTDREDCFLAAFDKEIERVSRHILGGYDSEAKWTERIRTALVGLLSFLDVDSGAGWLLIVGSLGAGAPALERRQRVTAQMVTLVDEGREGSRTGKELPPLTAEGIVGGVLSVLHARLLEKSPDSLMALCGPMMSMIVLPYRGWAAAQQELKRPTPTYSGRPTPGHADPLRDVEMRLTYRTVRVLLSLAARPGSSNRDIGLASGIQDQGQISKLLTRLAKLGLVENEGVGQVRGAPNAWMLTRKGLEIEQAIGEGAR